MFLLYKMFEVLEELPSSVIVVMFLIGVVVALCSYFLL
jgi:hypothetical protein